MVKGELLCLEAMRFHMHNGVMQCLGYMAQQKRQDAKTRTSAYMATVKMITKDSSPKQEKARKYLRKGIGKLKWGGAVMDEEWITFDC